MGLVAVNEEKQNRASQVPRRRSVRRWMVPEVSAGRLFLGVLLRALAISATSCSDVGG